jgi:hypothetical protein
MSVVWPAAKVLSLVSLFTLPFVLAYGLIWGFRMRLEWPRFSATIRRGFWVMVFFGASVTMPMSLSTSLLAVDLLLLALGVGFYLSDYAPAIRRYGRVQCWAAMLCLVDFVALSSAGLLDQPQAMGCAAARSALLAVCLQLFVVGIGVWLSIMLPLISEMRRAMKQSKS